MKPRKYQTILTNKALSTTQSLSKKANEEIVGKQAEASIEDMDSSASTKISSPQLNCISEKLDRTDDIVTSPQPHDGSIGKGSVNHTSHSLQADVSLRPRYNLDSESEIVSNTITSTVPDASAEENKQNYVLKTSQDEVSVKQEDNQKDRIKSNYSDKTEFLGEEPELEIKNAENDTYGSESDEYNSDGSDDEQENRHLQSDGDIISMPQEQSKTVEPLVVESPLRALDDVDNSDDWEEPHTNQRNRAKV